MNSYRKGYRAERGLVQKLRAAGLTATRVPLSGATSFAKGDIILTYRGTDYTIEVKSRKNNFSRLYSAISKHPALYNPEHNIYILDYNNFVYNLTNNPSLKFSIYNKKISSQLLKWLSKSDILMVKADRKEYICLMRKETFSQLKGG